MVIMTTQVYYNYHNHHHHHNNILTLYVDPHGDHGDPGVLHRGQRSRQADVGEASRDTLPCLGRSYTTSSRKRKKHLVKANIQPVLKKYSNCNNVERKEQPFLDRGIILWYRPTFLVAATVSCSTATLELYLMGQLSTPEMEYSDEKVSLILLCVLVCCLAKDQLKKDNSKSCKK